MTNFASKFLTAFGILLIFFGIFLFWERTNPNRLAFSLNSFQKESFQNQTNPTVTEPKKITIKDLNISLPIIPAKMKKGDWETTTKGVSYLSDSPLPGERGNSILYGHNWSNILGNLTKIKKGQKIDITFNNGSTKTFKVEDISIVDWNQTYVLNQTKDTRITLYTCTGFLDRKRFVVTAVPISNK